MGLSSIRPFHGRMDSMEDSTSYFKDIEYAVEMEIKATAETADKHHYIFFRQNLRDRAEKWFATLPPGIRNDWP